MSDIPKDLRYAKTHEWARAEEDGTVTIAGSDGATTATVSGTVSATPIAP